MSLKELDFFVFQKKPFSILQWRPLSCLIYSRSEYPIAKRSAGALYFTIPASMEFEKEVRAHIKAVQNRYEKNGVKFEITFSQQKSIGESSTHFNPVDLVCGVRDYRGNPFNLLEFRDPDSGFITHKSKDGKDLKALELPGLWNGGMAYWNTVFIEVPFITFNPVKTVFDLLRDEHQPGKS